MNDRMGDISFPDSGRVNRSGTTRSGNPKVARVTVRQSLRNPTRQDGVFRAVLIDPDTGEVIKRVELWAGSAGEMVEMSIEFVTTKVHPRPEGDEK